MSLTNKKIHNLLQITLFFYTLLLTYMLLRPANSLPKDIYWFEGADKVVHFGIFGVLGFLFEATYPKQDFYKYLAILLLYAIFTEIAQHLMDNGRSGDIMDLLADILGIIIAYIVFRYVEKW
jgi:VanZ-like protein